MNRRDIISDCPEGSEDWLNDIIDHFEFKFNEIKDKLDISEISELGAIEEAYNIADAVARELY